MWQSFTGYIYEMKGIVIAIIVVVLLLVLAGVGVALSASSSSSMPPSGAPQFPSAPPSDGAASGGMAPAPAPQPAPTQQPAKPSCSGVTLFEHANYDGRSWLVPVGFHDYPEFAQNNFNDILSSIKVPAGCKAVVYEHAGRGGQSRTYTSDVAFTADFNDMASSIDVSNA